MHPYSLLNLAISQLQFTLLLLYHFQTRDNTKHNSFSASYSSSFFCRMQQNQKMEGHKSDTNKTNPRKDGVIITVYVESPKSHNNSHQNRDANALNKINPKSRGRGYDRRAQLLAYSRDLRNLDSPLKPKKWKLKVRSETRYERVGMGREDRAEVVDQRCRPKCFCFQSRTKKATGKSGSSILMKMKSLLRELSKGCKRRSDD
ncbi:uncharacterized protein LOC111011926 [Momordica charantia]|uniref:Uncharacterized protein LOC111011926 n=1 Tax=Momordica charantia TaxID=3673 RepID=A0A6J1CJQ0_MOMCH|nr:uncharacterized protein LOC111011926 [Momordica charantia]